MSLKSELAQAKISYKALCKKPEKTGEDWDRMSELAHTIEVFEMPKEDFYAMIEGVNRG